MADVVAEGANKNPLLKDGQDQFSTLLDSADNIKLDGIAGQNDGTINDAFVTAVQSYCNGELDSEEACQDNFLDAVSAALPDEQVD